MALNMSNQNLWSAFLRKKKYSLISTLQNCVHVYKRMNQHVYMHVKNEQQYTYTGRGQECEDSGSREQKVA